MSGDFKPFQFRSPRIVFKRNAWKDIPNICEEFGKRGLLITGAHLKEKSSTYPGLMAEFEAKKLAVRESIRKGSEPTVGEVELVTIAVRQQKYDWVLGIGGGSTIDLAKAVAGLARNEGSAAMYQEGKDLVNDGIPFIAVPTTAGTGSELTNNAVLINEQKRVKLSIRGDKMMARVAVFDPVLTVSMTPEVTAHTGLDALTQAIESYVSKASNPFTDLLAERAIGIIWDWLYKAWKDGSDIDAREQMLFGNLLSALSFSNAKLGAVHGFAHPIGAIHAIHHGLICGVLLPHVMKFNLAGNIPEVTRKFAVIGAMMKKDAAYANLSDGDLANIAIENIFTLLSMMGLPTRLSGLGLKKADIPAIVNDTKGTSLLNNPRDTTKELLTQLLTDAL
nr:iron-containing alcohol dehydrogenase [Candidatus Sigynarchaeota archaeon]